MQRRARAWRSDAALLAVAVLVFVGCLISPPGLMDDVDASHAQLARNMVRSGDWVIPHLNGVPYIEKAPLPYWLIAISYLIFGVHDWAARIPFALSAVLLCWVTMRYGCWAFGERAGFYSGLVLATCVGLFLFTRILIPDVMLALCVVVCLWSLQRALNEDSDAIETEKHPGLWAAVLPASLAVGVLLKGLLVLVIVGGASIVYLALIRRLFSRGTSFSQTWRALHLVRGLLIFLAIAAPWHVMAMRRMPPYFDFTMHSEPGEYHGFFWFYFMNEHVLRFLGLRYPRDYNTVPRLTFWLLNLLWLFPWSFYLPAAFKLGYRGADRASRTRLLALCATLFLLVFFTFSTTQEYYSLPIYPSLALLLGCAIASGQDQDQDQDEGLLVTGYGTGSVKWLNRGRIAVAWVAAAAAVVIAGLLIAVRNVPAPGDISRVLQQNPSAYTLSLGHLGDLTIQAFAYLRAPLALAGLAFLVGAAGSWLLSGRRAVLAQAAMMVLFFHASRMALTVFDPYLGSRPLAEALTKAPQGRLIVDGAYYPYSSVLFYADRTALLLNGRKNNLEYGSLAPGSPAVFIGDQEFAQLWTQSERCYLITDGLQLDRVRKLVGSANLKTVAESGGKLLLTQQ